MSTKSSAQSSEPTFEDAQHELEQIVQRLESGQAGVEDAIALAERGELLYRLCAARLEAAEGKVEELSRQPREPDSG